MIDFTLVSAIENIEVIAANRGIRDLARLKPIVRTRTLAQT